MIQIFFGYMNENPDDIRNQKDSGGGALYDIGCYAVSVARFLTEREPKRVMCSQVIDPVFFTDTITNGILDFDDISAVFNVSTKIYPHQRVDICGEKGMITVDMPFNAHHDISERLIIRSDEGETIELCGPADQYQIQFESFAQRIINGEPPLIPPSDAIANMHVIDQLFRSAESLHWEKV
jgi:predicted dehydrogenase